MFGFDGESVNGADAVASEYELPNKPVLSGDVYGDIVSLDAVFERSLRSVCGGSRLSKKEEMLLWQDSGQ